MSHFSPQLSFKTFFSSDKFILAEDVRRNASTHFNRRDANAPRKCQMSERISNASTHHMVETIRFEHEQNSMSLHRPTFRKESKLKTKHTKTLKIKSHLNDLIVSNKYPCLLSFVSKPLNDKQNRQQAATRSAAERPNLQLVRSAPRELPMWHIAAASPTWHVPHNTHPQHTRGRLKRRSAILSSQWSDPYMTDGTTDIIFTIQNPHVTNWTLKNVSRRIWTLYFSLVTVRNVKRGQCWKMCTGCEAFINRTPK
jgi:hypothetical protein